jgi:flagellar biosynthesis protein FlhG
MAKEIWAFAGGKGGTGKSLFAATFAILLGEMGKKVIAIDVDFGGGGLHNYLRWPTLEKRIIADFVSRKIASLGELVDDTIIANVKIIGGTNPNTNINQLTYDDKRRLLRAIPKLNADFILLDLGPGISYDVLDFALLAEKITLILLPEPTSIENSYAFIKAMCYRTVMRSIRDNEKKQWLFSFIQEKQIRHFIDLLEAIKSEQPELAANIKDKLAKLRFNLVINQARTKEDDTLGHNLIMTCEKFIGISPIFTGYLAWSDRFRQVVKWKELPTTDTLGIDAMSQINGILHNILNGTNAKPNHRDPRLFCK